MSLVAEKKGDIIGHVTVSPVSISASIQHWYGLAPISVPPKWQSQGVGSTLMEQALTELQKLGAADCVVLGEPQYYGRFGFKAEPPLVLPNVLQEYSQAISFEARVSAGALSYHEAFHVQG